MAAPPLSADCAKLLPGGKLDDTAYQALEDALDRALAPMCGPDGRWLTLAERVAALGKALAEADALIATHQFTLDRNPSDQWPEDSFIRSSVERHADRKSRNPE
ncbi:hypothetical protein N825_34175 [Skermanella stibiiresistens SB22]|uniref:Uncharacterized protein n=1 Tax=Skermanella stibiiresistens SB22 TaxID=1385369 RepID=W9GPJ6_9PROT|nr:hypothetical protein [Skermanella stibiiresistens]EWY35810.1 hypothetical protein N825_34175 [Skermanella stibiiresistens SB22]